MEYRVWYRKRVLYVGFSITSVDRRFVCRSSVCVFLFDSRVFLIGFVKSSAGVIVYIFLFVRVYRVRVNGFLVLLDFGLEEGWGLLISLCFEG